jgi:plasmid stabilization system protein ParE
MSRNVIGRAERNKAKTATTAESNNIEIIPATQTESTKTETWVQTVAKEQPKAAEQPATVSLQQQHLNKIEKHRQSSRNYYYNHKEKVIARIVAKRREKKKQRYEQKLEEVKKEEAKADRKDAGVLRNEEGKKAV